jgi:UDP-N-acetylglucosamine 3-dehydrogenase
MAPLRFAVIGVGVWGQRHAAALAAIAAQTGLVRLVALADPDEARRNAHAAALGVRGYDSWQRLFESEALDAACVCTPDQHHVEVTLAGLARGLHLLVEKPLALTASDAARLAFAARAANRVVTVGHILRFVPQYRAAREAVEDGRLGDLIHLIARRSSLVTSGERIAGRASLAMFQAIHDLDILRWIGGPVTRVYAEASARLLRRFGVADTLCATLRFSNGAIGAVECSWALPRESPTPLEQELDILGTGGRVHLRLSDEGVAITADGTHRTPHLSLLGAIPDALRAELMSFIDAINGGGPPAVGADDAAEAVRLAEAVDRSLVTGRPVDLE